MNKNFAELTCKLSAGCISKYNVSGNIRNVLVRARAAARRAIAARSEPAARRVAHMRTYTVRALPSRGEL